MCVCVQVVCVSKLCGDKLCGDKLCGSKLFVQVGAAERRGQAGPGGSAQPKTRTPHKDVGKYREVISPRYFSRAAFCFCSCCLDLQ